MPADDRRGVRPRAHAPSSGRPGRRAAARRPKRRAPASESIDVRTTDGWSLRTDVHEPPGPPRGVAVLAHAMMARRSAFDRPRGAGLARFLLERGWRVVAFDFRGHGDSGPRAGEGAEYRYDDFVRHDLPAIGAFARSRAIGSGPVILVGHSLGGHAALAAQGAGLVAFDGVVAMGANVWIRELEPSRRRWLLKRAVLAAITRVARGAGRFPARALRLGSDDESRAYCEDIARFSRTGAWTSADGRLDYLACLGAVRVPVLQVVSHGDPIYCAPACGARFVARCGGRWDLVEITRGDGDVAPPDHMGLVTSPASRDAWGRVEAWMRTIRPVSSASP